MKSYFNFFFRKKVSGLIFVLSTVINSLNAQTSPPERISYQGIARDLSGNILSNQLIGIKFIIHQGSAGGVTVFTEQHSVTTNSLGLFTLQIGSNNTSAFSSINWANGPYFLEVQMDPNGGTAYTFIGTQQMLSVPYALYAKNSYSASTSYSTENIPPISITTNTSSTNATVITVSQGTNSASATINFPPAPIPAITITGDGITAVTPTTGSTFTISTPTPTFNNGTGINVTGTYPNYTITNTATNQTVNIANGTNVTVNGTYPNYTINATPTLAIVGTNSLSISGGNTVQLPISNPTITGSGITAVTPTTGNVFTINTPSPSLSTNTDPNTGVSTLSLTQGAATSTASIPSPTNFAWGLTGNANTNTSTNFLGTTDNKDLIFKTNSSERMRISSTNGFVGISTTSPNYPLHTVYSGTAGAGHYIDYTSNSSSGANSAIFTQAKSTTTANIFGGYFQVMGSNASSFAAAVEAFATSNANQNVGIDASATGTTTGANYGGYFSAFNASTNYGITANASGTTSNSNYGGAFVAQDASYNYGGHFYAANGTNQNTAIYAEANGTISSAINYGILAHALGTGNTNYGGSFNVANANTNYGINSNATGTANINYGGYFNAFNANTNYGINANATGTTTGTNYGGYFIAQDAAYNYGGYFYTTNGTNQNIAIHADAFSTVNSADNYGIRTFATGTANFNYGGYFNASGGITNYAVYATITATDAASSAIYATSNGTNGKALYAESNGTGDVIYAKAASSSTKNALVIDNGHIKATGTNTMSTTYIIAGGFQSPLGTINVQGNDVRGLVSFVTAATNLNDPNYCSIQVNFVKPYSSAPHVIITPANGTDVKGLSYSVSSTTNYFIITIYRSSNMTVPTSVPTTTFSFNYFVIE